MEDSQPRLLVDLRPRDEIRDVLNRLLPNVPWGFLGSTPPAQRSTAVALLVGAFSGREPGFDPASCPLLDFVQTLYTGVNGFPFEQFGAGVRVAGNVGAFAPFVSEHAVALALAAARDLNAAQEMVRLGRLRPAPKQRLLYGATAVILGYGEIGRAIAQRLTGFEARVIGMNRTGAPAPGCAQMYSSDRLREVVALGDFVFEVRPLTERTRGTIGKAELEAMRPEAIFVNVGRAGTVDEEALYRHLEAHPSFRAGIDVWWNEKFSEGSVPSRFAFAQLPNVVATPHSAGAVAGAERRALELAVENMARYFRDGRPSYVVDRAEYTGEPAPVPVRGEAGPPAPGGASSAGTARVRR